MQGMSAVAYLVFPVCHFFHLQASAVKAAPAKAGNKRSAEESSDSDDSSEDDSEGVSRRCLEHLLHFHRVVLHL